MTVQLLLNLVGYGICFFIIYDQHVKMKHLKIVLAHVLQHLTQEEEEEDNAEH